MEARGIGALVVSAALAACAPIVGSPRAVIQPSAMRATVNAYPYGEALRDFYGTQAERGGLSRHDYRDMVLSIYLGAIDAEYYEFRRELAASGRGSALGLDLLVIGLAAGTAIAAAKDMEELAVATTAATGSRAAIDKNLFFDRTLPSVISAMDAERARVRAAIERKLDLDEDRYPLPAVFNDIAEYQLAGTLERGLQRVATVASADAADAQEELTDAIQACEIVEDLRSENRRLSDALLGEGDVYLSEPIKIAATELNVELGSTDEQTYNEIVSSLNTTDCTKAARKAKVDRILAAIKEGTTPAEGDESN